MKPEEGLVIQKLVEIKEKFNIPWDMSEYSKRILSLWIDKMGGGGGVDGSGLTPPPSHFPAGPPPPPPAGGAGGGGHCRFQI